MNWMQIAVLVGFPVLAAVAYVLATRSRAPRAPAPAPTSHSDLVVELVEKFGALQADMKNMRRELGDLDESVEHRFKRFNARARRATGAPGAPTEGDPEPGLPDVNDLFSPYREPSPPASNGAGHRKMVPPKVRR